LSLLSKDILPNHKRPLIKTAFIFNNIQLLSYFFKRELKGKYLGNITGMSWAYIQPVITLLIYWFVFGVVFKQRVHENPNIEFIVYLAIGFWPWVTFSEAVLKSIKVIEESSDLLGKVNMDFKTPVLASVSATFVINLIGYIAVLVILFLFAGEFNHKGILLLIFPIVTLYIFALSLAFIFSSIQIFIKDTNQIVGTVMTLWFFLTPILYSESILPEKYQYYIQFNPLYIPISFIHKAILTQGDLPWLGLFTLSMVFMFMLYLSIKLFNKLAKSFVDFK